MLLLEKVEVIQFVLVFLYIPGIYIIPSFLWIDVIRRRLVCCEILTMKISRACAGAGSITQTMHKNTHKDKGTKFKNHRVLNA